MQTPPALPSQRARENILVTVRVRPLSARELAQKDVSAWECVDGRTIVSKPPPAPPFLDRSPHHNHPKSYTFDHVFGPDSVTERVYEEGAKDVALSVLSGLNATIFAYGQTSSGKTFTMRGITDKAVNDLYAYMQKHNESDFIIRVSALEIYNEVVKDLLNSDSGPLRLLDDPEKGTIVERLAEEVVKDSNNLRKILSIVEAQRQVGETSLNDASSRSHQIIRLTVESFPRNVADGALVNSLVASLNLVDLAGSERASQTHSEGTRLKEGCHINRSLLTLTTIIRKLSGQGRNKNGHLPYRDSKLTRILQNSLGGNARTAIICTMSPAQTQFEQSRNTLFFATHAKEVTNTAQVNMVVSDKAMVKLLQKEVARLEAELRFSDGQPAQSPASEALLNEKEAEIQQLRAEVKELHYQRDLAQSRLDELLQRLGEEEAAKNMDKQNPVPELVSLPTPACGMHISECMDLHVGVLPSRDEQEQNTPKQRSPSIARNSIVRQSSTASLMLVQEIRKLEQLQDELGEDANRALEALQKEVECLRLAQAGMNQDAAATISKLQAEIHALKVSKAKAAEGERMSTVFTRGSLSTSLREEITRLQAIGSVDRTNTDNTIATLEEQLESVQKSIANLVLTPHSEREHDSPSSIIPFDLRRCNNTPCSPRSSTRRSLGFENNENNPPYISESRSTSNQKQVHLKNKEGTDAGTISSKESTPTHRRNNSVDIKKMQNMFKTAAEENIRSIRAYVTELKERVAKLQYQKQLLVCQVLELEANGENIEEDIDDEDFVQLDEEQETMPQSPESWQCTFQKQRMQIVELWDACQVSIIHRSQFYLLFKGDPADQVYLEVELRRLAWLQEHFADVNSTVSPMGDGGEETPESVSLAASARALRREREQLARRMRCLTEEEREEVYQRWRVPLGAKQRKIQVAYKVWTDPRDETHIQDSAVLVARIVGFWNPNRGASKEMFELAFAPPSSRKPWLFPNWNTIVNNLNALNI